MRRSRPLALLAAATIVLAACGSGSTTEPAASPAPAGVDADPAPSPTVAGESTVAPTGDGTASGTTEHATDEANGTGATETTAQSSDGGAADGTVAATGSTPDSTAGSDDAPADVSDMARPDDGCSVDGSPTPTDVAAGPAPEIEIRAASANGPFPDIPVRRINCKGGWESLRNELPAEQPLLVWFWAPH